MNNVFRMVLISLICLMSVSVSYGGTYELMNLIENKEFWSNYDWGIFEDSELYKSTQWNISGYHGEPNGDKNPDYSANVDLIRFGIGKIIAFTDSNKKLYYIPMHSQNRSQEIYQALVNWCVEKFGNEYTEYQGKTGFGKYAHDMMSTTWKFNNSTIMVMIEDTANNDPRQRFTTSLIIQPNRVEVYNVAPPEERRQVQPALRPPRPRPAESVPAMIPAVEPNSPPPMSTHMEPMPIEPN